ncbi:protein ZAR1-like [Nothobranchius furzeri]|uniref:Zygote arrest 1-like n=1 Tax=Nothobranchius furzeri TaxID=105023 RepID=A0A8C6M375_NOTFU|nr:ZAR1-like protein [Nothobranchius furzeri]KAF7206452.1 zygote arrest 1-like [Nothobranchius furzeri]
MEGFLHTFPPYNAYGNPVCAPPAQGSSWGKREGRFMIPPGLSYLELCKTILSQVSPGAHPPPPARKENTKECGVQVNAKVDKIVQCSLGPKTLLVDEHLESPGQVKPEEKTKPHTPPVSNLRFRRPVSIYSPVFDRRAFMKSLSDDCEKEEAEASEQDQSEAETDHSGEDFERDQKTTFHRSNKDSNFQFLEQRYGFFHCKKCNIRWESAYVWCISGTSKVYYKQLCRKCQVGFNPYRVESILCKGCSQTCCICEKKQRHINMKRPHRQDLCCRCKGMRLSCDATYSFKYIV